MQTETPKGMTELKKTRDDMLMEIGKLYLKFFTKENSPSPVMTEKVQLYQEIERQLNEVEYCEYIRGIA